MYTALDTPLASTAPALNSLAAPIAEATQHATLCLATCAQLVRSKLNVRRKQSDVSELMGLIRTQGLLQNLIGFRQMVAGVETGIIEIIAGGRRLNAIGLLIEAGFLPEDYSIPVLIVSEDEAIEISVTENLGREDMHPADLFEAMQDMVQRGRSMEDVALLYSLDLITVKRRLKLANVAPPLLDLYRNDEANFEQMMALAITDDHAAQEQAWNGLGKWSRSPGELRRVLTANKVKAGVDRVARFVGLAAYEQAGGTVTRDLFSDREQGYIDDVALLERLAVERLEKRRAKLLKEGVLWVDILPRAGSGDLMAYARVRRAPELLSDAQQQEVDALTQKIDRLDAWLDSDEATQDEARYEQLVAEMRAAKDQRDAIHTSRKQVANAGDRALAGAVMYVNGDGQLVVLRDLIRPSDKGKMASLGQKEGENARRKPVHSDRLVAELTAQRTVALQAEMMAQGQVALAYLTYTLLQPALMERGGHRTLAKIGASRPSLTAAAKESTAAHAVQVRREQLLARLPKLDEKNGDAESLLAWLAGQPQTELLELLAFCVATSLDGTQAREEASSDFVEVAKLVKLDMGKWWHATADNYFNHVSKGQMMKVVSEAVSASSAVPLEKMRKNEAAQAAMRALAEANWLPEPMRVA